MKIMIYKSNFFFHTYKIELTFFLFFITQLIKILVPLIGLTLGDQLKNLLIFELSLIKIF